MNAALLVRGGHVHTADDQRSEYRRGSVLCVDGAIAAIGEDARVTEGLPEFADGHEVTEIDASGMLVLPGLVNAHWHASLGGAAAAAHPELSLWGERPDPYLDATDRPGMMSGRGDVCQVSQRFAGHPEARDDTPVDEAAAVARYAAWTQLRCGITTVADAGAVGFEHVSQEIPAALGALGIRGAVAVNATDGRCTAAGTFERTAELADVLARVDAQLDDGTGSDPARVRRVLGAGYALSMSADLGRELAARSDRLGLPFLTHVACFPDEAEVSAAAFGSTPVQRLAELGLLTDRLIAVHCGFTTETELALLLRSGAHVNYSPAKYGQSGESPVLGGPAITRFVAHQAAVSLSTDGLALPVGGMVEAMQAAWQLHNQAAGDNTALRASRVLQMATIEGARALGWQDSIGSLEAGKRADLVLVPAHDWRYLLRPRPLDGLLMLGSSNDVALVIVDGEVVLDGGVSTRLDEAELREQYLRACRQIALRRWGSDRAGTPWLDRLFDDHKAEA